MILPSWILPGDGLYRHDHTLQFPGLSGCHVARSFIWQGSPPLSQVKKLAIDNVVYANRLTCLHSNFLIKEEFLLRLLDDWLYDIKRSTLIQFWALLTTVEGFLSSQKHSAHHWRVFLYHGCRTQVWRWGCLWIVCFVNEGKWIITLKTAYKGLHTFLVYPRMLRETLATRQGKYSLCFVFACSITWFPRPSKT